MHNLKMDACVIAGGKGTRLRPLTSNLPKPLVKLLGKPIIEYIFELLTTHNVENINMAIGFQGGKLIEALDGYEKAKLNFFSEDIPLGTAGAVKNAMQTATSDFIVMSGDAMCDFDLTKAYEFHKANESMVTLIGTHVADPREYGLVLSDKAGRIKGFLEKPSYHNCSSDCASSGIYIISPKVLELIKPNCFQDFANDIFPTMLESDLPIYCYEDNGYWCDIGDLESYRKCQLDMLNGRVHFALDATNNAGIYTASPINLDDVNLSPPIYIGEGATIAKGTTITAGSVIGANVTIAENAMISSSIILDGAYLGRDTALTSCICCAGATVHTGATILENAVVGANSTILENAVVSEGVKVWANKTVPASHILTCDLHYGTARKIILEDDGICGQANTKITPELMVKIGSSIASLKPFTAIGIGYSNDNCSLALYYAVCAGVMSAGGIVWSFGSCIKTQLEFCMAKSMAEYGIYIDGGEITTIKLYEKGGLSTCRLTERKIEAGINHSEFKRILPARMGHIIDMASLVKLYQIELLKQSSTQLDLLNINIKCSNKDVKQLMQTTLYSLGCKEGEDITIAINSGGIQIYDMETTLNYGSILVLVCLYEFMLGEDVYLPITAPQVIDTIAQQYNAKVHRYPDCPCSQQDIILRQKAIDKPFLRDELMMTIKLFCLMQEKKLNLSQAQALIPQFEQSNRVVPITKTPSIVLKNICCEKQELSEGVRLKQGTHTSIVRPLKSGEGIMIFSEVLKAQSTETAVEICDIFEELIRNSMLDI